MTDIEEGELFRLQSGSYIELAKYVDALIEKEFQYGYDSGWDDSEIHNERR